MKIKNLFLFLLVFVFIFLVLVRREVGEELADVGVVGINTWQRLQHAGDELRIRHKVPLSFYLHWRVLAARTSL